MKSWNRKLMPLFKNEDDKKYALGYLKKLSQIQKIIKNTLEKLKIGMKNASLVWINYLCKWQI